MSLSFWIVASEVGDGTWKTSIQLVWVSTSVRNMWPRKGPAKSRWSHNYDWLGHFHGCRGTVDGLEQFSWHSWQYCQTLSVSASMPGHHTNILQESVFIQDLPGWPPCISLRTGSQPGCGTTTCLPHNNHHLGQRALWASCHSQTSPRTHLYHAAGSPHGAPGEFTCFFLTDQDVKLTGPRPCCLVCFITFIQAGLYNHCSNPELSPYFPRRTTLLSCRPEWQGVLVGCQGECPFLYAAWGLWRDKAALIGEREREREKEKRLVVSNADEVSSA